MSWARDSIRIPLRQPYCAVLTAHLHVKLIPLPPKTRYAEAMSTASILPAASRARRKLSVRRLAAWLVACASDPVAGPRLVISFAVAHAAGRAVILLNLEAAHGRHIDR